MRLYILYGVKSSILPFFIWGGIPDTAPKFQNGNLNDFTNRPSHQFFFRDGIPDTAPEFKTATQTFYKSPIAPFLNKNKKPKGTKQMGKFSGYLICTDLDDTLLTTDKKISQENKDAIKYFMNEGGLFTFATGRMPQGVEVVLKELKPNAPIVCANGASIYDFNENKFLMSHFLDDDATKALEYIEKRCPYVGIEVNNNDTIYFCKSNRFTEECKMWEQLDCEDIDYHLIKKPWKKIVFMMEAQYIGEVKKLLMESEFCDKYSFMQSSPNYYEILPKGVTKGEGMLELAHLLGIHKNKTIGIGDSENDLGLVKKAGIGVAVENAMQSVKDVADWIVCDNNNHAIKALIEKLESEL